MQAIPTVITLISQTYYMKGCLSNGWNVIHFSIFNSIFNESRIFTNRGQARRENNIIFTYSRTRETIASLCENGERTDTAAEDSGRKRE